MVSLTEFVVCFCVFLDATASTATEVTLLDSTTEDSLDWMRYPFRPTAPTPGMHPPGKKEMWMPLWVLWLPAGVRERGPGLDESARLGFVAPGYYSPPAGTRLPGPTRLRASLRSTGDEEPPYYFSLPPMAINRTLPEAPTFAGLSCGHESCN
ncbi:unnamed protein product [Notodromas monacha]|uniref:Uncharacterized protein n=1 Tax=Notodromas monacha TaxID=399045 RepID=A0A7R9BMT7_9CRUS|nr:unnamed protein product [Notodromas monacha]CAG0917574.1 unnamed protein product [Notodromas monacha]